MTNPSPQEIRALADAGGILSLRVVPGAKVERAAIENGALKLWTRTAPEDGKATKAVLAQSMGTAERAVQQFLGTGSGSAR